MVKALEDVEISEELSVVWYTWTQGQPLLGIVGMHDWELEPAVVHNAQEARQLIEILEVFIQECEK